MDLPRGGVGWSLVCDCGIFGTYSLAFLCIFFIFQVVTGLNEFKKDNFNVSV